MALFCSFMPSNLFNLSKWSARSCDQTSICCTWFLLPVDFYDVVIGVMEINNYTIAED